MIDGLRFVRISLSHIPAKARKELIEELEAHGHELPFVIYDFAEVAEIKFDGSCRIFAVNWDGESVLDKYGYSYLEWTYELIRHLLDGMNKPMPKAKPIDYCSCKIYMSTIIHAEDCKNWIDLRKTTPWGIPANADV